MGDIVKIEDLYESITLTEAPLPPDWDASVFSHMSPYKRMVEYAKARAQQIGRGSSRVVFEIPFQGKKSALKISLNSKGMAQNEEEANLLSDYYVKSLGIVIPIIDYDETSRQPTWIHTEYADKITQKQLERYFGGVPMNMITGHLDYIQGKNRSPQYRDIPEHLRDNDNYLKLEELISNYGIPAGDLSRKSNWGLYKGSPVIIDLGFTDKTAKLYR